MVCKRLYNEAQDSRDKKRYLREAIRHYEQGMYLDLNSYYCSSNLPRLLKERGKPGDAQRAESVAHLVVAACERAQQLDLGDEWLNPKLLGAAFDAAAPIKARELLERIEDEGAATWKLQITIADLERSVSQVNDPAKREKLKDVLDELGQLL